jgi:hypothetical protein
LITDGYKEEGEEETGAQNHGAQAGGACSGEARKVGFCPQFHGPDFAESR